jgi:hypothetical protein
MEAGFELALGLPCVIKGQAKNWHAPDGIAVVPRVSRMIPVSDTKITVASGPANLSSQIKVTERCEVLQAHRDQCLGGPFLEPALPQAD